MGLLGKLFGKLTGKSQRQVIVTRGKDLKDPNAWALPPGQKESPITRVLQRDEISSALSTTTVGGLKPSSTAVPPVTTGSIPNPNETVKVDPVELEAAAAANSEATSASQAISVVELDSTLDDGSAVAEVNDPAMLKKFGEAVIREGLIPSQAWAEFLNASRVQLQNEFVGALLVKAGLVEAGKVVYVLSKYMRVRRIDLHLYEIPAATLDLIKGIDAHRFQAIPVDQVGRVLNVAVNNPFNLGAFKALEQATGKIIKPVYCADDMLQEYLEIYYPTQIAQGGEWKVEIKQGDGAKKYMRRKEPGEESSRILKVQQVEHEPSQASAPGAETRVPEADEPDQAPQPIYPAGAPPMDEHKHRMTTLTPVAGPGPDVVGEIEVDDNGIAWAEPEEAGPRAAPARSEPLSMGVVPEEWPQRGGMNKAVVGKHGEAADSPGTVPVDRTAGEAEEVIDVVEQAPDAVAGRGASASKDLTAPVVDIDPSKHELHKHTQDSPRRVIPQREEPVDAWRNREDAGDLPQTTVPTQDLPADAAARATTPPAKRSAGAPSSGVFEIIDVDAEGLVQGAPPGGVPAAGVRGGRGAVGGAPGATPGVSAASSASAIPVASDAQARQQAIPVDDEASAKPASLPSRMSPQKAVPDDLDEAPKRAPAQRVLPRGAVSAKQAESVSEHMSDLADADSQAAAAAGEASAGQAAVSGAAAQEISGVVSGGAGKNQPLRRVVLRPLAMSDVKFNRRVNTRAKLIFRRWSAQYQSTRPRPAQQVPEAEFDNLFKPHRKAE